MNAVSLREFHLIAKGHTACKMMDGAGICGQQTFHTVQTVHNTFGSCPKVLEFDPVQNVHELLWLILNDFGQDKSKNPFGQTKYLMNVPDHALQEEFAVRTKSYLLFHPTAPVHG